MTNDGYQPLLVPVLECFQMIGVGVTKGYEEISEGRLDARKVGRKTLVTMESIKAYVASLPKANIRVT